MERQYIGVDLHKATFQACAVRQDGSRIWEAQVARTAEGLAAFAARDVQHGQVAVEATGPTWAFVDALHRLGATVCVVDTRKTKLKAGFAANTGRLDARRLADALRRESVVSIYLPPPEIRELRDMTRGRQQVVRTRTRLVQAIRALLLRHDRPDPPTTKLTSVAGLRWLSAQHVPGEANARGARSAACYKGRARRDPGDGQPGAGAGGERSHCLRTDAPARHWACAWPHPPRRDRSH
jgi:transposase